MNATLYRLRPRGPFHFGEGDAGESAATIGSDTLFSAVCLGLRDLFGPIRLAGFLRAGASGDPPVRFSSLMPTAGRVIFLPAPLVAGPAKADAAWVSLSRFAALARGETPADPRALQGGALAIDPADAADLPPLDGLIWQVNAASRASGGASHSIGRVEFAPGCGLAALAIVDPEWRADVDAALAWLADAGIGGERSSGYGQFDLTREAFDIPEAASPTAFCTLSLYLPTATELADGVLGGDARYRLVDRGGWAGSNGGARRKRIRMIGEGSVLAALSQGRRPAGQLADVTPEGFSAHRVLRCGWALPIGVAEAA